MYKQINRICTNVFDKRIFSCWLLYNTLIHMFTFTKSLQTQQSCQLISWLSTSRLSTQHSMRANGTDFSLMNQNESNTRPAAAWYV